MARKTIEEDEWEEEFDPDEDKEYVPDEEEEYVPDNDDEDHTILCPFCQEEIHEQSERCPYCEKYLSEEDSPANSQPWWILLVAVALVFAFLYSLVR